MATREKLKRPNASTCAGQCRQMGIVVGDTIVGRETYTTRRWSEDRLTVLFIGKEECVFKTAYRSWAAPRWRRGGESSSWTLECRAWYKLATKKATLSTASVGT